MIKLFSEVSEQDRDLVGGKAYNQARLWQEKFNVPPGLIITASAFDAALTSSQLKTKLPLLDQSPEFNEEIFRKFAALKLPAAMAKQLTEKFAEAFPKPYPHGFAVRSSALGEDSSAHSFAGIHRTLLGVSREEIADAIVECWASALAPTAINYRRERGLSLSEISIAVLIQPLILPRTAGVGFTVDPISGDQTQMIINASYGLGEMLVSGQVEPDIYRLQKGAKLSIASRQLGAKAEQLTYQEDHLVSIPVTTKLRESFALTETEILALGEQLQRIETCYHAPQDVEWAIKDDELFILQSRPVTSASAAPARDLLWSRANLREIVPDLPSAFCGGLLAMSEKDFAFHYDAGGVNVDHLRPTIKIIYGRPYFNITIMRYVCDLIGMPADAMMRMLGHGAELQSKMDYKINYRKALSNLPILIRSIRRQRRYSTTVEKTVKGADREIARIRSIQVNSLSYPEIPKEFDSLQPYFHDFLFTSMSLGGVIMMKMMGLLQKLDDLLPEPESFINGQIAVGEKNISAQQGFDLLTLGEIARGDERCKRYFSPTRTNFDDYPAQLSGTAFLAQFQDFLQLYGHRAIYETDGAQPRFYEDPTYLLSSIRNMVNAEQFATPAEIHAQQEAQAARDWQILAEKMRAKTIFAGFKLSMIRRQLKQTKALFALRERIRSEGVRVMAAQRELMLRLAGRLVREGFLNERGDLFYLEPAEMTTHFNNNNLTHLQTIVEQRKARYQFYRTLEMPNLIHDSELPFILKRMREDVADVDRFTGLAVSAGVIEGEVIVLKHPGEFAKMQPGKILVAPATDPAWTPLFAVAIGVIVEMGGILSHGSIVAREYGLPTVVNIPGITRQLKDGDRVRVDGTNGVVEILKKADSNRQTANYVSSSPEE